MFPFTHTYILKRMYELVGKTQEEIPLEIILGNAMPDFIVNFDIRHDKKGRDFHIEVHDTVPSKDVCYYDLEIELERGFTVHVMADNYSRVGKFWRSNGDGQGFIKSLEKKVDIGVLETDKDIDTFVRRVVQTAIDFAVLEEHYDDMIRIMRAGVDYLEDTKASIVETVAERMAMPLDHVNRRIDYMIERYGENVHFHAKKQIIAYSAIRVIDDHGQSQLTSNFIDMIETHPVYPTVLANLNLAKDWKKQLDETAQAILESPVGKYVR